MAFSTTGVLSRIGDGLFVPIFWVGFSLASLFAVGRGIYSSRLMGSERTIRYSKMGSYAHFAAKVVNYFLVLTFAQLIVLVALASYFHQFIYTNLGSLLLLIPLSALSISALSQILVPATMLEDTNTGYLTAMLLPFCAPVILCAVELTHYSALEMLTSFWFAFLLMIIVVYLALGLILNDLLSGDI
jgi:ABC-type transport system involved in cytochrome c biogenesis permease component